MKLLPLLIAALALAAGGLWWMSQSSESPQGHTPSSADARPRTKTFSERLRNAMRDTDRGRRSARFATVWSGMTAAEAAELAPELLAHEAGSPFQNDWLDFLQRWGVLDPRAALTFAATHGGALAGDWTRAIARGWATADPHAAATWWFSDVSSDREALGSLIIGRWAGADWQAATDWVQANASPADQPGLANALAIQILEHDPEAASSLVDACRGRLAPPNALEISLFNHLSPSMPLPWLEQLKDIFPKNPAMLERVRQAMAADITESQPPQPGAKAWLLWLSKPENTPVVDESFGTPDLRSHESAFRHWLAADPEDASRWLGKQTHSPLKDACIEVLVYATAESDPVAAQEWLRAMSTEKRHIFYENWRFNSTQKWRVGSKAEAPAWLIEDMKQDGVDLDRLRDR